MMTIPTDTTSQVEEAKIDLSSLIVADFSYLAQTAFQANEERAKATTFYLLSVVSVLATIWAASLENIDVHRTALAFSVVFGALSVFGVVTLMQLARLRSAWFESVTAMNYIKDYVVKMHLSENSRNPFPWTQENLPDRFAPKSVAAFLMLQVVFMSAVTSGACIFHLGQLYNSANYWLLPSIVGGVVWGGIGLWLYFWALSQNR